MPAANGKSASMDTTSSSPPAADGAVLDPGPVLELIESIQADLERLRGLLQPRPGEFEPSDPRNKNCDGKLTDQGVECCYRMFDEGKSRYAVARAMRISFAAATHRFTAWLKAGGKERRNVRLG